MFVIVASATCILLVVILIAISRGKRPVPASQRTLYASPGRGAGGSITRSISAQNMRPPIRQGLNTKAAAKATFTSTRYEAAKPANSKSLTDRKVKPVIFPPMLVSTEAPAESASFAVAAPHSANPVEATVVPALPPMIEGAVSSPLTDDSATHVCAVPAQEAAEIKEAAPSLAHEASVAETSALPDHQTSEIVERTSIPTTVDGPVSSVTFSAPVQAAAEAVQIPHFLVIEDGASNLTETTPQEAAESEVSQGLIVAGAAEEPRLPSLLAFYGLNQQPFDVTPDPAYLYRSRVHREAYTALSQGIENLRGFMTLIAEPGLGKTTLLHKLMEELQGSARVVFLFQTQCTSSDLLRYLLSELGVEYAGLDTVAMHRKLNELLFQEMLHGRRFVLIVDEAQNLDDSVLETIRLLSDFETTHSKLIQIVLAGQPQLVDTLTRPGLAQLRQRISVLAGLEPLGATETAEYVEHRMRAAGWVGEPIFTRDALALIAERSEGVPRCINNLCFHAMLLGYLHKQDVIDSEIVERVASKMDMELLVRHPQPKAADDQPAIAPYPNNGSSQLARLLVNALAHENQAGPETPSKPKSKPVLSLNGKLTEKLTSQSWGKKNEFRIQVSLERDYSPALPIADHYYCCSFYVSEEQATSLRAGKPIRIKFEQD